MKYKLVKFGSDNFASIIKENIDWDEVCEFGQFNKINQDENMIGVCAQNESAPIFFGIAKIIK